MVSQSVNVMDFASSGIYFIGGYRDDFRVISSVIFGIEDSYDSGFDNASGESGIGCDEAYIQRISVSTKGLGDKSVVARVVHAMMNHAIQSEAS